jgi:2-(1,2-epoxy-1,2-dihydrophenyl)acetyl-CoA isomerase
MNESPVLMERHEGVAVVTMNRPRAYNALDLGMAEGLLDVLIECDEADDVKVVVLRGAGTAFCAGGDVRVFAAHHAAGRASRFIKKLTVFLHGAVATIARMPKPVIAAVQGPAAGAGFSLAMAADLVVAGTGASFTMAYTRVGLAPDGSSTFTLPRLVGSKRAFELIVSNRALTAPEAQAWGLVNEVVEDDELESRVRRLAADLARGPATANAMAKELVARGALASLEAQMEHERQAIAAAARSADFGEGVRAFLERRAPVYAPGAR